MNLNFYVGQKVVAVDVPEHDPFGIPVPLVNGRVYTITALLEEANIDPRLRYGLTLYEVEAPHPYKGFVRWFFRPATQRLTDISIFKQLFTHQSVPATAGPIRQTEGADS